MRAGYQPRALCLHLCFCISQVSVRNLKSAVWPVSFDWLLKLPGTGSVCGLAFAPVRWRVLFSVSSPISSILATWTWVGTCTKPALKGKPGRVFGCSRLPVSASRLSWLLLRLRAPYSSETRRTGQPSGVEGAQGGTTLLMAKQLSSSRKQGQCQCWRCCSESDSSIFPARNISAQIGP